MSDGEVRMRVPFSECEGVGVMSTVSRRKFFGLVGGAAAVATLPRQVLAVGASVTPAGTNLGMGIKAACGADLLYGLQYNAIIAHVGTYAGIDRSAKP